MSTADRFWDRIARRYDKQTRRDEDYDRAVERFARHLRPDDTVLDYACGTGVVAFKIAPTVKEVHAIDSSAGMIAVARERARSLEVPNVRFAVKTIFDEELAGESFDMILALNILHLVEDARAVLQRAAELLEPGGLLVSSTPCLGESWAVVRTVLPLLGRLLGLSYLRTLRIAEVKELIEDGGFRILESEIRGGRIRLCFVVARRR